MPLVEQSKQLAAVLDDAKAKLDYMKSGDAFFTSSSIKDQEQTVASLQKEWDGVQKKVETMNASIAKDTRSIERMSTRAGELSAQIAGASKSSAALAAASKKADEYMDRFVRRVKGLARRVFIFGLIAQGLRSRLVWESNQKQRSGHKSDSAPQGCVVNIGAASFAGFNPGIYHIC